LIPGFDEPAEEEAFDFSDTLEPFSEEKQSSSYDAIDIPDMPDNLDINRVVQLAGRGTCRIQFLPCRMRWTWAVTPLTSGVMPKTCQWNPISGS
jgi:hypothetical protein